MALLVAARNSPLSSAQVGEAFLEMKEIFPAFSWRVLYVETRGDLDLKTSLKEMEQSDFFTRELDEMLLQKQCRICIHSAKDLPIPMPIGLTIAAITKGVDSSDSLVMREKESLSSLPKGALIATSSKRREEAVRRLRNDFCFTEVRGKIEKRLERLWNYDVDGIVIAEAALIRLKLNYLNRLKLICETAAFQGKLAIVVRREDYEMLELFSRIDIRKRDVSIS